MADERKNNAGYINFSWNERDGVWHIGGNYIDQKGVDLDLGYCKVGQHCLQEAIQTIAKQIGPSIAGKGVLRKERPNGGPR